MKHTLNIEGTEITFEAKDKDAELIKKIVADLLTLYGFVNLDAEDVKAIVDGEENLVAGEGTASGENRCAAAGSDAVKNIKGAKKLLAAVKTSPEVTLTEMMDAAMAVQEAADPDAVLIWGHVVDEALGDSVRVSVVAAI